MAFLLTSCEPSYQVPMDVGNLVPTLPEVVSYNFHIKPILSDRCFNCHGPHADNRKAGLRLDIPEQAYARLDNSDNSRAIVPGSSRRSTLLKRILHHEPDQRMPPTETKQTLTDYEKALLIKWIDQGAPYEKHWAYQSFRFTTTPEDQHPIDLFIDRLLQKNSLQSAGAASKESLLRRAAFDLTGLPPTIAEIDDFLADPSDDAFDKVIDRLIASPAYGERMANSWMDVARYADSDGYLDDKHRDLSPYRD